MWRRAIAPGLALLAVLCTCAVPMPVCAEQTLTITLDASEPAKDDMALKHETTGATRENASKQTSTQTQSKSGATSTPIGRVGVITVPKANITSSPSSKSRVYYTCPKDTYLAIVTENKDWYGVLMSDGSTGWIPRKMVSLLDYQVVGKQTPASAAGNQIVNTAIKYLGIPYVWGGYSFSGLDCSGFVKAVFASHGISLPRVARDQANVGAVVPFNQLQAGDRLYFACKGSAIDHTGIYIGNGMFIHASSSRGGVGVDDLISSRYAKWLVIARRS